MTSRFVLQIEKPMENSIKRRNAVCYYTHFVIMQN